MCGAGSPCSHRCEEGLRPSRSKSSDLAPRSSPSGGCAPTTPMGRALRPSTPGDFPVAEKVTKGAPRAAPFGIPGAWLPHFPRSLRFAPARAVLLPAFLPAALQARQHGGHIPPRLSPPPFGTLIACGFPFPYPAKKLLDTRWAVQAVHGSAGQLGGRSCSPMRGMGTGNGNKGTNISFSYISISIYIFYK